MLPIQLLKTIARFTVYLIWYVLLANWHLFAQQIQWEQAGSLQNENIKALAVNSNNDIFAATWVNNGKVFRSTDNGNNWEFIHTFGTNSVWDLFINADDIIFASIHGDSGIYISVDNGDSWQGSGRGLVSTNVNKIISSSSGILLAATNSGVFISHDRALSWLPYNNNLPAPNLMVTTAAYDPFNNSFLIGTFGDGAFRSGVDNADWVLLGNLPNPFVNDLAVLDDSTIIAAPDAGFGIYKTTDGGSTWNKQTNGLSGFDETYSVLSFNSSYSFLIGQTSGVYIAENNIGIWSAANNGLTKPRSYEIIKDQFDILFIGTATGVYKTTGVPVGIETRQPLQRENTVILAFPNPFNSTVRFQFNSTNDSNAKAAIYDITGKRIKTFQLKTQNSNGFQIEWNGHDDFGNEASSGIYVMQFTSKTINTSLRILYLK